MYHIMNSHNHRISRPTQKGIAIICGVIDLSRLPGKGGQHRRGKGNQKRAQPDDTHKYIAACLGNQGNHIRRQRWVKQSQPCTMVSQERTVELCEIQSNTAMQLKLKDIAIKRQAGQESHIKRINMIANRPHEPISKDQKTCWHSKLRRK